MDHTRNLGAKRAVLGKGLGSLLGVEGAGVAANNPADTAYRNQIRMIKLSEVESNPNQPRKYFDEEALNELAQSIESEGVLQPIIVTRSDEGGKYSIVAGERRWRASKLAGRTEIPAIVREGSDEELVRIALIENIQRADLNIIEEAKAYASLIRDFGLTQEACAKKVGKQRSTITNALRILSLPTQLHDDLMDGTLSMGHARALLGLENAEKVMELREMIIDNDLSVRQVEKLVQSFKEHEENESQNLKQSIDTQTLQTDADLLRIETSIRDKFQTKVRLVGSGSRGKIEISYFSLADLERILESLEIS